MQDVSRRRTGNTSNYPPVFAARGDGRHSACPRSTSAATAASWGSRHHPRNHNHDREKSAIRGLYAIGTPKPNSEVRNNTTFGVLKLTLGSGSYAWQFVPVAGAGFTDSGTGSCH
jgi:hypothetical protein